MDMDQGQIAMNALAAVKETSPLRRGKQLAMGTRAFSLDRLASVPLGLTTKAFIASFWLALLCLLTMPSVAVAQGGVCSAYYTYPQAVAGCQSWATSQNSLNNGTTGSCVVGWNGGPCTDSSGLCAVQAYTNGAWRGAGAYEFCPAGSVTPKELGKPCNCAGDPINVATGNEFRDDEDISLGSLSLHRYYNSQAFAAPAAHMGTNWRHTFNRSIEYQSGNTIDPAIAIVFRPEGRQLIFKLTSGQWVADQDVADRLTAQTNASGAITGWTYVDAATRYQERYDSNGNLLSITDTDGLITALTYSTTATPVSVAPAAGLLLTVTDPRGRALNFTYNSGSEVSAITEPAGGVVTYTYDGNGNLTSVTYPDQSSRRYLYNETTLTSSASILAALTGDIDETGTRFTSIGYNAQGQATMSMLASNIAKTQVAYNADGTTTVTYPTGSQSTLTFSQLFGASHGTAVSTPCGVQCDQPYASATYDANGRPASRTDFNGNVTKTTYDADGLLDQQIDASGSTNQRTTNFTWNTTLRVPLTRAVLDANGNTVSNSQWVYNSIGQTLARCEIDPSNSAAAGYACSATGTVPPGVRRWTYTYCTAVDTTQCPIAGLMLTATSPRTDTAQTTTYSYYLASSGTNCGTPGATCYQAGDLHTVTDPSGHVTTIASYDADGRITRITDANGVNTDLTYTPRGWLASRTLGGATTSFTYTPYGAVQTVTDPDGVTTTYGYDAAHRLVKITDASGNYLQYTLDAAGNKTAEQVADVSGTLHKGLSRTFNTLGQLTKVMDGLNHTIFDASASASYNANGNLVQSTDGLGIQRQLGYDVLNRLVQTLDNYNGSH
jgi:YD repeat-containing protein